MKRITLFVLIFTGTSIVSKAQIEKGNILIGGNLGFTSNSSSNTSTLSLSPSFARAYKNNRLAGFSLTYSHTWQNNKDLNTSGYGASVFLRQYKPLGKSGFSIFAQETLGYNYLDTRQPLEYNSTQYIQRLQFYTTSLSINPGFAYDISSKVQLELLLNNLVSLSYTTIKSSELNNETEFINSKQNIFNLSSSSNLSELGNVSVGVRFILGRK